MNKKGSFSDVLRHYCLGYFYFSHLVNSSLTPQLKDIIKLSISI